MLYTASLHIEKIHMVVERDCRRELETYTFHQVLLRGG